VGCFGDADVVRPHSLGVFVCCLVCTCRANYLTDEQTLVVAVIQTYRFKSEPVEGIRACACVRAWAGVGHTLAFVRLRLGLPGHCGCGAARNLMGIIRTICTSWGRFPELVTRGFLPLSRKGTTVCRFCLLGWRGKFGGVPTELKGLQAYVRCVLAASSTGETRREPDYVQRMDGEALCSCSEMGFQ